MVGVPKIKLSIYAYTSKTIYYFGEEGNYSLVLTRNPVKALVVDI